MEIEDFEWDQANVDHIGRRGLTEAQIESITGGRYLVLRNKREGAGDYQLIGRDHGGRLVTVIIAATESSIRWRPVTAWYSDAAEQARARRSGI